ncbi:MAG TPA: hypothetical protein VLA17_17565 [Candidatus Limnocylindria bacterium]|nr:hypothetical protein [Candidatus Limnocylindria bacterium]
MNDRIARRLALLEGIDLSPADIEYIASEIEDFERVVAELGEFSQGCPWISLQAQPGDRKD